LVASNAKHETSGKQVVPLSARARETVAVSLGQELDRLSNWLDSNWKWPSPEAGFAVWIFRSTGQEPPFPRQELTATDIGQSRWSDAPILGALGYAFSLGGDGVDSKHRAQWCSGATRLTQRDPFPTDRASFFYRPVELLGLALGVKSCAHMQPGTMEWLRQVIVSGQSKISKDAWSLLLGAYSSQILGAPWNRIMLPRLEEWRIEELALLAWLRIAFPKISEAVDTSARIEEFDPILLDRAATSQIPARSVDRTAVVWLAVRKAIVDVIRSSYEETWQIGRAAWDAAKLVEHICRRFPLYVRQLSARYSNRPALAIGDEYDVQDAMHALLKLHFDDIRSEEWAPSYAGTHTRLDFLLKREELVIETKMTRKGLNQRKIVEELVVDKERYRAHPDCRTLVCFVYDPEGRCDNPNALENDFEPRRRSSAHRRCGRPQGDVTLSQGEGMLTQRIASSSQPGAEDADPVAPKLVSSSVRQELSNLSGAPNRPYRARTICISSTNGTNAPGGLAPLAHMGTTVAREKHSCRWSESPSALQKWSSARARRRNSHTIEGSVNRVSGSIAAAPWSMKLRRRNTPAAERSTNSGSSSVGPSVAK
jgi:hypothetical protein